MVALANPLGGNRQFHSWRGHAIAYVVQGSGAPLLLVHSVHAAAWSMEWRLALPLLAEHATCFALDLLGFGASDRPAVYYTADLYEELIADFLRDVVRKPATIIGSSFGGTYGIAVASKHPDLVRAVCAIGPAGASRLITNGGKAGRYAEALFRSEFVGSRLFNALVSRGSIEYFMRDIYTDRRIFTKEVSQLFWDTAHQPGARFAPAAFVGMKLNHDIRRELGTLTTPLLLVWGMQAAQTPFREAEVVRRFAPQATFVALPGGDLPHEEQPALFVQAVTAFLNSLPAPTAQTL